VNLRKRKGMNATLVVLILEDEPEVRRVERRILDSVGYRVIEALDGTEALRLINTGTEIDLLIADLEMPGLDGDEMVRQCRVARPDLKVLYVSGRTDRHLGARALWEGEAFFNKPFSANGLLEAVNLTCHVRLSGR